MITDKQFMPRYLLLTSLTALVFWSLAFPTVAAPIYKTKDKDGNVVFSDQGSEKSERVVVEDPVTYDSSILNPTYGSTNDADDSDAEPIEVKYSKLEIVSPVNDTAIRNNAGNFTVSYLVEPRTQQGHTVQLMMDGKVHEVVNQSGSIELENADRGTHSLQLQVIQTRNDKVFQSSPVSSVTILRHSIAR